MLNKVILIGNLGKDPEVRHLEGGSVVAKFSVATNENYKDKSGEWRKNTEWHDIVAWRYLAEKAEKDFKKGGLVYVEGKLTTRKWQDQNGNDRYSTEIIANVLKSLEKREETNRGGGYFPTAENEPKINSFESGSVMDLASKETKEPQKAPTQEQEDDLPF